MADPNIDTLNRFGVATRGGNITLLMPPRGEMTREVALVFAAWLVALADDGSGLWERTLDAVQNS